MTSMSCLNLPQKIALESPPSEKYPVLASFRWVKSVGSATFMLLVYYRTRRSAKSRLKRALGSRYERWRRDTQSHVQINDELTS